MNVQLHVLVLLDCDTAQSFSGSSEISQTLQRAEPVKQA
jgi:hypothetical protein